MNRIAVVIALTLLPLLAFAQARGDWVLARWQGGEYWFPGVIEKSYDDRITIAYDDGTRETLPLNLVRPYDWRVGTRVQCKWAGGSEWYAAQITAIGSGSSISVVYEEDGVRERTDTGSCRSW